MLTFYIKYFKNFIKFFFFLFGFLLSKNIYIVKNKV